MRIYTFVFSVIVHALAIAWVIIAPALATDVLPEPPRTSVFMIVRPDLPDPIPPPIRRAEPTPSPEAAPLQPPNGVQPERIVEPVEPGVDDPGALVSGGVTFGNLTSGGELVPPPPPPARPKEPQPVGGKIQPPKKIVHVAPVYPPIALAAGKPGLVILQAVIDESGVVREVKVLRSDPLFDEAAMNAVRQWRFTQPLLNGEPVPVVMTVTVGFTIGR
jgi:protein TonB